MAAPGVLANDTDADGDTLTATGVTQPGHGTVTLADNGSFTYVPASGFHGVGHASPTGPATGPTAPSR